MYCNVTGFDFFTHIQPDKRFFSSVKTLDVSSVRSGATVKAGQNVKFPWNMVNIFVKNVNIFQILRNLCKKKTHDKYFPQNCKDFSPKAQFPGNKIPKFHILSIHRSGLGPKLPLLGHRKLE